jgi:hypothetical protein
LGRGLGGQPPRGHCSDHNMHVRVDWESKGKTQTNNMEKLLRFGNMIEVTSVPLCCADGVDCADGVEEKEEELVAKVGGASRDGGMWGVFMVGT